MIILIRTAGRARGIAHVIERSRALLTFRSISKNVQFHSYVEAIVRLDAVFRAVGGRDDEKKGTS